MGISFAAHLDVDAIAGMIRGARGQAREVPPTSSVCVGASRLEPLDPEAKSELLARLRETIARHGARLFLEAAILEPSDVFFPDRYTPDLRGVRRVALRLARYAGMGELALELYGVGARDDDPMAETHVRFVEVDPVERVATFWVDALGADAEVPLVIAHEVARMKHALAEARGGGDPYRSAPRRDVREDPHAELDEDEALEARRRAEEEIALLACALGFGLLVAIGAHTYRVHGELLAFATRTRWQHRMLGALRADEAAYLLAAHAVVLELSDERVASFEHWLGDDARAVLGAYTRELRAGRPALLAALGLPPESEWPARWNGVVPEIPEDAWRPAPRPEEPGGERLEGARPVLVWSDHAGIPSATATGIASVIAWALLALTHDAYAAWPWIAAPFSIGLAYLVGRTRRTPRCSSCAAVLAEGAERCASCGGRVVGTLGPRETPLAALQRLRVRTNRAGFIVEPQADADARYVALGIACPGCGWVPDGEEHWACDACDGPRFDTFATGGACPTCEKRFEETSCVRCHAPFEHAWWWPGH